MLILSEKGDQPIFAERRNDGSKLVTTLNNLNSNKNFGDCFWI